MDLESAVKKYSVEYMVEPELIYSVIDVESRFQEKAKSKASAIGLMQVLLSTAKWHGFTGGEQELYEIENNVHYGVKHLSFLQDRFPDLRDVISAYNAGHNQDGKRNFVRHPYKNPRYVNMVYKRYLFLSTVNDVNKLMPFVVSGNLLIMFQRFAKKERA